MVTTTTPTLLSGVEILDALARRAGPERICYVALSSTARSISLSASANDDEGARLAADLGAVFIKDFPSDDVAYRPFWQFATTFEGWRVTILVHHEPDAAVAS